MVRNKLKRGGDAGFFRAWTSSLSAIVVFSVVELIICNLNGVYAGSSTCYWDYIRFVDC